MADETEDLPPRVISVDFVAGQLQGIKDHLKRQDIQSDKFHADNQARFGALESKMSEAHQIATKSRDWIRDTGEPAAKDVKALQEAAKSRKDKAKGAAAVWGAIAAFATLVVTTGASIAGIGFDNIQKFFELVRHH